MGSGRAIRVIRTTASDRVSRTAIGRTIMGPGRRRAVIARLRVGLSAAIADGRSGNAPDQATNDSAFRAITAARYFATDNRAERSTHQAANNSAAVQTAIVRGIARLRIIGWTSVIMRPCMAVGGTGIAIARLRIIGPGLRIMNARSRCIMGRATIGISWLAVRICRTAIAIV